MLNRVIDVEYSNIRCRILDFALSNLSQGFWIFVKPESRCREANIRNSVHCFNLICSRSRHSSGRSRVSLDIYLLASNSIPDRVKLSCDRTDLMYRTVEQVIDQIEVQSARYSTRCNSS